MRATADRRLVLAAVVFGLAAGNHSLTLLLAPAIALFVLAVEPGIWRRWRFVARVPRRRLRDDGARVPGAPDPGRPRPGPEAPIVYGRAGHVGRLLVHRPRASSSGARSATRSRDLGIKVDELVDARDRAARGPGTRDPARDHRHGPPRAAIPAPDGRRPSSSRSCSTRPTPTPTSSATTSGPSCGSGHGSRSSRPSSPPSPGSSIAAASPRGSAGSRRTPGTSGGPTTVAAIVIGALLLVPPSVDLGDRRRAGRPLRRHGRGAGSTRRCR